MSSAWNQWKKRNAARQRSGVVSPVDFINPNTEYATAEEQSRRYSICENCPHLTVTKQCTKCGCFMPAKTKLLHASCPIKEW